MFLGGIIAGAIIGGASALLYAPQKGSETRNQLMSKLNDLEKEMNKTKDRLKRKSNQVKEDVKEKVKEI